jgi:hypothetical protein
VVGEGKPSIPTGAEAVEAAVQAANDASRKAILAKQASKGISNRPAASPQLQPASTPAFQRNSGYVSQWAMMHGGVGNIHVPSSREDKADDDDNAAMQKPLHESRSADSTQGEADGKDDDDISRAERERHRDDDEMRDRNDRNARHDGGERARDQDRHASLRGLLRGLLLRHGEFLCITFLSASLLLIHGGSPYACYFISRSKTSSVV